MVWRILWNKRFLAKLVRVSCLLRFCLLSFMQLTLLTRTDMDFFSSPPLSFFNISIVYFFVFYHVEKNMGREYKQKKTERENEKFIEKDLTTLKNFYIASFEDKKSSRRKIFVLLILFFFQPPRKTLCARKEFKTWEDDFFPFFLISVCLNSIYISSRELSRY